MSTLAGTLVLRDVLDVEALVRKVVDDRLRQWGARLNRHDHEDLVSYLIGTCWELSGRYDPEKDRNPNFGSYAARILSLRVADWYRQRFGDTRHGDRPVVLSLDAPATLAGDDDEPGAGPGGRRLVDALPSSTGDPSEDRAPDLVGILERGSGPDGGPLQTVGQPPARRAPRRARAGVKKPRVAGATARPHVPHPVCNTCRTTFLAAFKRANKDREPGLRLSELELLQQADKRARAVKFAGEWVCPRCTTVPQKDGTVLFFAQVYPNREARRNGQKAGKKKGKTTKYTRKRSLS